MSVFISSTVNKLIVESFTAIFISLMLLDSVNCRISNSPGEMEDGQIKNETDISSKSFSLAVVPYDENKLTPFQHKERKFTFGEHKIIISQQWDKLGVAAVVWDAAACLCQFLERNKDLVRQKRLLELGAGTGLVGILASKLEPEHITLTDRSTALTILEENVNLNIVPDKRKVIDVQELEWGVNHMDFSANYDIILGADIIYIEETFHQLLQTFLHLTNLDTIVIIACRIRYLRDSRFLKMLEEHFSLKQIDYNKDYDVKIYQAQRKPK